MPSDTRFQKYSRFLKSGSTNSQVKPVAFKKDRVSIIVQSSGSTGKAKSIMHTEYNFNSSMQKEAYTDLPYGVNKTMYTAIPPFIIYGLRGAIYGGLVFGMKVVMTPFVSETTVYDDLGKYDCAAAAPIHLRFLYNKIVKLDDNIKKLKDDDSNDSKQELLRCSKELQSIMKKLSKVKVFVSGGDKITEQEILNMQHLFETPIVNGYGNNELTGGVIISPIYAGKPNSVGIPMKGVIVAAFEPDTFDLLDVGTEGEICISTDSIFMDYLNNEEETKRIKQMHDDGLEWIHTGDLGYVDEDGYVYITGRTKRLIKREAFKIAPETVENVILELEEVRDCVVVGVPDIQHQGSFVPMAYVEVESDLAIGQEGIKKKIKEKCESELPDYEIPSYIECIDKIPYKNTKHDFKQLEAMGAEYVKQIMG